MTEFLSCVLMIMQAVLGSGQLNFDYRDGNVSTWFTAPSSETRIGHIESDLSIKGNIMYLTRSGPSFGELRSTGGGNTNPTTVLTRSTVDNMTERMNSTVLRGHAVRVVDFRQVSANALILQLSDYYETAFSNRFYDEDRFRTRGCLSLVIRETEEMRIVGKCQFMYVLDAYIIDTTINHHIYLISNRTLLIVDLKNYPESFIELLYIADITTNFKYTYSYLSQHEEYVYICVLSEFNQQYKVYRVTKIAEDGIPFGSSEGTQLDIDIPNMKSDLRSFIVLDGPSFLVGSISQLLLLQQGKLPRGVCNVGISFSEGTIDTCTLWEYGALTVYNGNVYIATEHRIARLVWLNNDSTPSINGGSNASAAEVAAEYIQWLLPSGLSVAGVLIAAILIFIAMQIRMKKRQTQPTARELPDVPQSKEEENYDQITAADVFPEEDIYNIIGDDYYELNVDRTEDYADINVIQPQITGTLSAHVQSSTDDYLKPVPVIDQVTDPSDSV